MSEQPEREFSLPGRRRTPGWVWLVVLALHVPLAFVVLRVYHGDPARAVFMSSVERHDSLPSAAVPRFRGAPPPVARVAAAPPPAATSIAPPLASTGSGATPASSPSALVPVDTPPTRADLHPRYGNGSVWVRPMDATPRELARTLTGKTDKQLTDSAVAAMVQTYLDAMAREQAANPQTLPSWTTKIGGKTVGLDSKWIYLGPIKIPTALLALLPIHAQGNMSDYQWNKQLELMRSDLFEAARRAATYDDFKRAVSDLHRQTEDARQFRKNQQTPPDTSHPG